MAVRAWFFLVRIVRTSTSCGSDKRHIRPFELSSLASTRTSVDETLDGHLGPEHLTIRMAFNLSSAGFSSPLQSGGGDIFLALYSTSSSSANSFPATFDTSGVDAIVAAYTSSAVVLDLSSARAPQQETSITAAADALLDVQDRVFAIQDLAYASSDPFLTDSSREDLQRSVESLVSEIQTIAQTTRFNGEKLFDGTSFRVKVGGGSDAFIQASGIDLQGLALSLSNLDVSTFKGAFKTYDAVERFSERLVEIGSRSLDSAAQRVETVTRSLGFLSGSATASSAPSGVGAAGTSMDMRSALSLLQAYQGGASNSSSLALLSLFA
jgi:flagellin